MGAHWPRTVAEVEADLNERVPATDVRDRLCARLMVAEVRRVEGERDRARSTAVRLEAELDRAEDALRIVAATGGANGCERTVDTSMLVCRLDPNRERGGHIYADSWCMPCVASAALVSEEPAPEVAEMCMVCRATGPINFECPHPDAHHPVANSAHDANGEPWEDEEPAPEPPKVEHDHGPLVVICPGCGEQRWCGFGLCLSCGAAAECPTNRSDR